MKSIKFKVGETFINSIGNKLTIVKIYDDHIEAIYDHNVYSTYSYTIKEMITRISTGLYRYTPTNTKTEPIYEIY